MLQLLLLRQSLLKLGLGQLSSVQQVSIELTAVSRVLTDRPCRCIKQILITFLWSCHFVVRKDSREDPGSI